MCLCDIQGECIEYWTLAKMTIMHATFPINLIFDHASFGYVFIYVYVCMSNRPVLSSSAPNKGAIIYTAVRVLKALKLLFFIS